MVYARRLHDTLVRNDRASERLRDGDCVSEVGHAELPVTTLSPNVVQTVRAVGRIDVQPVKWARSTTPIAWMQSNPFGTISSWAIQSSKLLVKCFLR